MKYINPPKQPEWACVVFFPSESKWWLLQWLNKRFRHCLIIIHKNDTLVMIETCYRQTHINVFKPDDFHEIIDGLGDTTDIIYTDIPHLDGENPRIRLLTCVGIIKHLLGIHNRWIWTPYQLYKRLLHECLLYKGKM